MKTWNSACWVALSVLLSIKTATALEYTVVPSDDVGATGSAAADPLFLSQWDHAFFKFPLTGLSGDVETATLRLYTHSTDSTETYIWAADSSDWNEASGKPTSIGYPWLTSPIASATHASAGYVEFDVTDFIRTQASSATATSIEVSSDNGAWRQHGSRHGAQPPQLIVNTVEGGAPLNTAPTADISTDVETGIVPLAVSFTAAASTDNEANIASYDWDFGNGDGASGITTNYTFTEAGAHTVQVLVSDTEGLSDTATIVINVSEPAANLPPEAGFTASTLNTTIGSQVNFDAATSSDPEAGPLTYLWDFGDSTTANTVDPIHVFATAGSFQVTLTVTDDQNQSTTTSKTVLVSAVNMAPTAAFIASPATAPAGINIGFDATGSSDPENDISAYNWDFGDGTTGVGTTPSHSFSSAGVYTVMLTVTDGGHLSDTHELEVTISEPPPTGPGGSITLNPSDDLGATNNATASPLFLSFWDHGFYRFPLDEVTGDIESAVFRLYNADNADTETSFWASDVDDWNEASGRPNQSAYPWMGTPICTVPNNSAVGYLECDVTQFVTSELAGDGVVTFEITNSSSGWKQFGSREGSFKPELVIESTGSVIEPPANISPVASFTASPLEATAPAIVTVDASSSADTDGSIASYVWNFDDGSSGNGEHFAHEYLNPGVYTVSLTVIDDLGASHSTTQDITILEPATNVSPIASFTASSSTGDAPLPVDFDAAASNDSDGSISSYQWDFGDGGTSSLISPSHTYNNHGVYTASLTVTDDGGATHTATQTITVNEVVVNLPPTAAFTSSTALAETNEAISFDASSSTDDNAIVSFNWEFGDGSTASGATTTHSYALAGSYDVTLTVVDNAGASNSVTQNINIEAPATGTGGTYTLSPSDDIGASNSGSSDSIKASFWDHAFIKFPLTELTGTVTSATLRIYNPEQPLSTKVWAAESDAWTENSGRPGAVGFDWMGSPLCVPEFQGTSGYLECDLTDFIAQELSGDGIASLELSNDSGGWKTYGSREGNHTPELVVETNGGGTNPPTPPNGDTLKIVTIGNSITQGNTDLQSYRYALWKKLVDANIAHDLVGSESTNSGGNPVFPDYQGQSFDADHEGHWGWRADQVAAGMSAWLNDYDADIALIHMGSNDLIQSQSNATTIQDITNIISTLRSDNSAIKVLLAQLIPADVEQLGLPSTAISEFIDLNDRIANLANDLNTTASPVTVVDQYTGFDPIADTAGDGVHPNAGGEEKMAQKWFDAIEQMLQEQPENIAPQADFSSSAITVIAPSNISFDASGSVDSDGSIASYDWTFGDFATGEGVTVEYEFSEVGEIEVTLTVTDNMGASHSQSQTISVLSEEPDPSLIIVTPNPSDDTYSINVPGASNIYASNNWHSYFWWADDGFNPVVIPVVAGQPVNLEASGIVNYSVVRSSGENEYGPDGDGSNGLANNGLPWYTLIGTYISDVDDTSTPFWDLTAVGSEFFVGSSYSGVAPSGATALVLGTLDPSHTVDESDLSAPYYTIDDLGKLDAVGNFDVVVTSPAAPFQSYVIANDIGNALPEALFSTTHGLGQSRLTIEFDASQSVGHGGTISQYSWDFGDGTHGSEKQATHTYTGPGIYTVTLTVTDNQGAQNITSSDIEVLDPADAPPTLKALLITGGAFHDYDAQTTVITEGIGERLDIQWDVANEGTSDSTKMAVYNDPDWAAGYDIIVHNECSAMISDVAWVNKIIEGHTSQGVPAVAIHCAMHSFGLANTDEWHRFVGVTSPTHEHTMLDLDVVKTIDHAITANIESDWTTPLDELYIIDKVWPDATVLATAYGPQTEQDQAVFWINSYDGINVFGTSLGHTEEVMETTEWLDTISNGILWATNRLQ